MHAYYLTRPVTLRTATQSRTLPAASREGVPFATELHIAAQKELVLVRAALQRTYPREPVSRLLRMLAPESLAQLPGMPPLLGVPALANPEAGSLPNLLATQLQALRSAHPGRRHYRLLLINGFGSNLGDNLIGLTAFRQVLTVLRAHLPAVTVDVLLGWHPDDRLIRLFRDIDGIEDIRTQGLTLAELGRYQGLFDTSDLLGLPGYGQRPMVDWHLWWLGLDPAGIPEAEKCNRVAIPAADRRAIAAQLPPATGPRLLINPQASVPLRTMPEAAARLLVERLLAAWPEAQIVLLHPVALDHPRLVHLAGAIPDVDRLAALVAAVDGLIGVDTYTSHLADGTATPAVTLYTSYPPGLYPYYPLAEAMVLPHGDQLPAWGKPKVTPTAWATMAGAYAAAWQDLDLEMVIAALRRVMAKKAEVSGGYGPRLLPARMMPPVCPTRALEVPGCSLMVPSRQRQDPLAQMLDQAIVQVAAQLLRPGDTVALLGAGTGSAVELARMVGRHGRLVAIEPRRGLHQLLCANLARADIWHAETHLAMPEGEGMGCRAINGLELADESWPLSLANCEQPEPVVCWPFDGLALNHCRLLVVRSPLARLPVLEGARATLQRLGPTVLIGVVPLQGEGAPLAAFFNSLNYRLRTLELGRPGAPDQGIRSSILVAEPEVGC